MSEEEPHPLLPTYKSPYNTFAQELDLWTHLDNKKDNKKEESHHRNLVKAPRKAWENDLGMLSVKASEAMDKVRCLIVV